MRLLDEDPIRLSQESNGLIRPIIHHGVEGIDQKDDVIQARMIPRMKSEESKDPSPLDRDLLVRVPAGRMDELVD